MKNLYYFWASLNNMTLSEENYLKAIYSLQKEYPSGVSTNAIAEHLETKPASATDMIKKLNDKKLVHYKPYQGVLLNEQGKGHALKIIRKHRLWETFLVEKLNFGWDEVHEVAEELEHIKSEKLIQEIDKFLGFPKTDPHGDPIPDKDGEITTIKKKTLASFSKDEHGICVGVNDSSASFLQYLHKNDITLGKEITVTGIEEFDESMHILVNGTPLTISNFTAKNVYLKQMGIE